MKDSVRISDLISHEDSPKSAIIITWGSRNQEQQLGWPWLPSLLLSIPDTQGSMGLEILAPGGHTFASGDNQNPITLHCYLIRLLVPGDNPVRRVVIILAGYLTMVFRRQVCTISQVRICLGDPWGLLYSPAQPGWADMAWERLRPWIKVQATSSGKPCR